jgi:hypothetical protein
MWLGILYRETGASPKICRFGRYTYWNVPPSSKAVQDAHFRLVHQLTKVDSKAAYSLTNRRGAWLINQQMSGFDVQMPLQFKSANIDK